MATPRSHKRHGEPTTLMSLGDDMLAEIIGRLPSLPSLARAAFVCRRLRNLVSSSTSSCITSRPAPLLGYFLSVIAGHIPSFHRALRCSDREVASIVRRGDFQLADFEDYKWRLTDGRHGLLLLRSDHCMAVFDPVAGSRLLIPHCNTMSKRNGNPPFHYCFILSTSDATSSLRVLCLESTARGRVRPHVYSSCTGEWRAREPSPKGVKPPRMVEPHSNHNLPMYAGGRIYWRTHDPVLTSFSTGSMEFSHLPLPDQLNHLSSYAVGDTEDGTTCIVAVSAQHEDKKLGMRVWFLKEEERSWERQPRVEGLDLLLPVDVTRSHVRKVYDVTAGVVLLSVGYKHSGIRYVALRLKDTLREAEAEAGTPDTDTDAKRRQSVIVADFCTSSGWLHPYFMAWPRPSLKLPRFFLSISTIKNRSS